MHIHAFPMHSTCTCSKWTHMCPAVSSVYLSEPISTSASSTHMHILGCLLHISLSEIISLQYDCPVVPFPLGIWLCWIAQVQHAHTCLPYAFDLHKHRVNTHATFRTLCALDLAEKHKRNAYMRCCFIIYAQQAVNVVVTSFPSGRISTKNLKERNYYKHASPMMPLTKST